MRKGKEQRSEQSALQRIVNRRRLAPQERLADDLKYYLSTLFQRLGFRNGSVKADWHEGQLRNVRYQVKGGNGQSLNSTGGHKAWNPEETQRAIESRLKRLLKHCTIKFGHLEVQVAAGEIKWLDVTKSYKSPKEKFNTLFE